MHGTFNKLMTLKNNLVAAAHTPGQMAAADWHYNVASLAYARYQALIDDAEQERKHVRFVNKTTAAQPYLEAFRYHTRRGDLLLN